MKHLSVAWLKDFIYNFDSDNSKISQGYFARMIAEIPKGTSEKDFDTMLQAFNDAWNVFPQKIMGDKSPQQKMIEIGGSPEIDPEHEGFIRWVENEAMPRYESSLKDIPAKVKKVRVGVAGVFFSVCAELGFFEISAIHPQFIKDFPDLFQASVTGPKLKNIEIKEALDCLLVFLETYYAIRISPVFEE